VPISSKVARFIRATRASLLIGGSTATFLILPTYGGTEERGYARRRNKISKSASRFELSS
jgi:hypothetical protein